MSDSATQRRVQLAVQALIAFVALVVLRPFLLPAAWAAILAFATWPVYYRLERRLRRPALAATVMTVSLVLLVLIPLILVLALLAFEVQRTLPEFRQTLAHSVDAFPSALRRVPLVGEYVAERVARFLADPSMRQQWLGERLGGVTSAVAGAVGSVGRAMLEALLTVLILFFFLRYGRVLAKQAHRVALRFGGERMETIFAPMGGTVRAVLYGTLLIAIVQGTLVGLGLWLAGVGAPALLGALTAALALTPVGAPLVWVPAVVWLVFQDRWLAGGLLGVWCLVVVSNADNLIRSWLLSGAAQIPFLLAIFGAVGGLITFGMLGLFIGPVALALVLALWREWSREIPARSGC